MASLLTAKRSDVTSFPGSTYIADGSAPIAQCQEAQIDETAGAISSGPVTITDVAAFAGIDLAGKKVTVTVPIGEAGTYGVVSNTDDVLTTDHAFGEVSAVTEYTVHDDGEVYLTRNEASFAAFAKEASAAYTFLNGKLYTDVAAGPMAGACTDTFAPG